MGLPVPCEAYITSISRPSRQVKLRKKCTHGGYLVRSAAEATGQSVRREVEPAAKKPGLADVQVLK